MIICKTENEARLIAIEQMTCPIVYGVSIQYNEQSQEWQVITIINTDEAI